MFRYINFSKVGPFIDKWLISNKSSYNPIDHWKARLLVSVHIFILLVGVVFEIVNRFILPVENPPELIIGVLIVLTLIFVFKKWGNLALSGNLLASVVFLVLMFAVFDTGGLFSDNLLFMLLSPLLALLFANRLSGFLWLCAIVVFVFYLNQNGYNSPAFLSSNVQENGSQYYMINYIGLFIAVVGIVLLFASGQSMMINALDENQKELTEQKTELLNQTESLKIAQIQLKAINQELEQFAYAASHDLKEPLRMIKMYTQFIDKRLKEQLDKTSLEYIAFVTDGVTRMERLLTDLLEYSRLGRGNRQPKDTNLNDVLLAVINNMTASMKENEAAVLSNELPVVKSTSTEMIQLFQNLISNSIKFRRENENPVIKIQHQIEGDNHHFYFMDNGIGIAKEDCGRVFNIFERLHGKSEYEGTGIGLATCKKIIDNLGGKIWVEPGEELGTTFQFVIPKNWTS